MPYSFSIQTFFIQNSEFLKSEKVYRMNHIDVTLRLKKSILSNNVHSYMSLNIEVNDYLNIIVVACNLICSAESSVTYIYKSIQIE